MGHLFSQLQVRGQSFRNRLFVSPMCQYSAGSGENAGLVGDWHLVHLGSRAVGGAGLVIAEATAVCPEGRISPCDAGLWTERHRDAFARITSFIRAQGAASGVQLAHAGRKASTPVPWRGAPPLPVGDGWQVVGPTDAPYNASYPRPRALDEASMGQIVEDFTHSTQLALEAGFDVIELHMAHGYLLHEFLSPLTNTRRDRYGGPLENRARLPLDVARAVRAGWPSDKPLFARLSCSDWAPGGVRLEEMVQVARWLQAAGVDLIDCSSGGLVPQQQIDVRPGYQVPFARAVRAAGVSAAAVGLITDPAQAEAILAAGDADAICMARELLRDPYFPLHAARALGEDLAWPVQYQRAKT